MAYKRLQDTQWVALNPPDKKMNTLEIEIGRQSKDTGIPAKELKRMCLRAGLEQLQKGELKVTKKTGGVAPSAAETEEEGSR